MSQRPIDPDGSRVPVLRRPVQGEDPVLQLRRAARGLWYGDLTSFPDPLNTARVNQINGLFTANRGIRIAEITDGTSQTMLLSERGARALDRRRTSVLLQHHLVGRRRLCGHPLLDDFSAESVPQNPRHARDLQQRLHVGRVELPLLRRLFRLRRRLGPVPSRIFDPAPGLLTTSATR